MEGRLSLVFFVFLPLVAVGYTPRTKYIEDYCNPTGTVYSFSKDLIVTYSKVRHIIPASYSCVMNIRNLDSSRQVQVRFLDLDMQMRIGCTAGAVALSERGRYLTPSYGVCGRQNPSQSYRTKGNQMTIELTNTGSTSVYGNFRVLVTSIYNATNSSCHDGDFKCSNQLCVSSQLICNGYNDCGDNSDETTGCALAAGVIVGIVIAICFGIFFFSILALLCRRRRRSYTRVTEVVREYPTVHHQPVVVGGYNPSYTYSANNYHAI